jgi:hypothetical protein
MGTGGVTEFRGWTFMKQTWWTEVAGGQTRELWKREGVVAVADPDEWHDRPVTSGSFSSWLKTPSLDMKGIHE